MMTNRISRNRIGLLLFGAGCWLTLWGCAAGPAPTDHYYRIDAGVPDAPAAKKLEGNLQIDRLRADALTGKRQLLYKETANSSKIRQHPYQLWSDPPTILLQAELVSFLNAAAAADSVIAATVSMQITILRIVCKSELRGYCRRDTSLDDCRRKIRML